ncbi:hypothetical protein [Acidianus bottle-shaped virus]|uniref:Uncharacterized protein ORF61a n=1 Tax=Acidianus bottle-shaped virus (isolate Italy/Pozzuoli) TaxID=654911 RepID=Y061A_ABVP|nr:hypothetical protein ABV_gp23 [Acidianus bottle-shaped virus]A4ZUA9.1 RecName: Full=Uncharacterized protein ORF61a [Acidianus bottle-shaped virus (isolate Pozzuoli)]ABP73413.1 hypothetical protein [Acidianus bottle-shaped virus]
MAQFLGLGDIGGNLVYELIMILYKIFKFISLKILDGLGNFMEIALEYLVKFVYQITRFIHR